MRAMVLDSPGTPLRFEERASMTPGPGQVRVQVSACAVCRTDLHVIDGELKHPKLPLVPGHQIVGSVSALGEGVTQLAEGERVGIAWLGWTCAECAFCARDQENLCDRARFTGYQLDGGYAEEAVADARFCYPLPQELDDVHAAPLLCAGLIGYRSLRMAEQAERIGFYGFGAAAHILVQVAAHRGQRIFAFTRPGDRTGQDFARKLGAEWAGDSNSPPPVSLDAAILFAPVGGLVPEALRHVCKGGAVICAGIHMSDIPSFPYRLLWEERIIRSVANLTRRDAEEFLPLAARAGVLTHVRTFPLAEANEALSALREGRVEGAAVLVI